jgi:endogenous inhibitor of DNA gyrase (YacG/DUF329 family)
MAMVQLKCPKTGKPVDIKDLPPNSLMPLDIFSRPIRCPHCGEDHTWTSGKRALAYQALKASPEARRILVDGESATALP